MATGVLCLLCFDRTFMHSARCSGWIQRGPAAHPQHCNLGMTRRGLGCKSVVSGPGTHCGAVGAEAAAALALVLHLVDLGIRTGAHACRPELLQLLHKGDQDVPKPKLVSTKNWQKGTICMMGCLWARWPTAGA